MIPLAWQAKTTQIIEVTHAKAIAEALEFCKVKYVVSLSSVERILKA
ncbi:MAG: hypothetical protein IPL25_19830 [Saprospiraceae bacterium]|nr:hypothetical protein [Candidatus Vicinibacter affinis]